MLLGLIGFHRTRCVVGDLARRVSLLIYLGPFDERVAVTWSATRQLIRSNRTP